ncbi:methyl-accepting chemotaxis protein [Streptomyces sp. OM5714]|nr:methyl-accepting chemotaxis protein [Streptomyces sp. OM5714]
MSEMPPTIQAAYSKPDLGREPSPSPPERQSTNEPSAKAEPTPQTYRDAASNTTTEASLKEIIGAAYSKPDLGREPSSSHPVRQSTIELFETPQSTHNSYRDAASNTTMESPSRGVSPVSDEHAELSDQMERARKALKELTRGVGTHRDVGTQTQQRASSAPRGAVVDVHRGNSLPHGGRKR